MKSAAANDPKWSTFNFGLSDKSGSAEINVSKNSVFSSLYAMTEAALHFDPTASVHRTETIQLRRLSDIDINGSNLFIKVDTQGHERYVISGAERLLDRVLGMQLELPISALYKDCWNFSQAVEFMRSLGFVPTFFEPVNSHKIDRMATLEVDCVFRRHDPAID